MKTVYYWLIAVVITLTAMVYQRTTGPTYPLRDKININNNEYNLQLTRSHGGESDCKISLPINDAEVTGTMFFKLYPTKNSWTEQELTREGEHLVATLPHLPPAGKYEYKITLTTNDQSFPLNGGMPVIIRFKGDVPAGILIPHIFLMFFAMLLGNLAGIMAIFSHKQVKFYTTVTLIALFIGGLILGPLVQLYAFCEAWAGVPFAWDLTDNKTLVAFLFWLLAFAMNRNKVRPGYTVLAALVMLLVYSIPHSMYGSELDPETGEIIQGWIQLIVF
ncbi:hypothetical protein [Maribellus sp. YY47]|uniref:hypothetical protein n=1 Tax=Maribellus sp. YY47 TaxID=2929486 RepID=UPI002000E8B0|nr:hypothetical protein [Maribellus sp. YY47]MCK3683187.1 hypothetical protein [Maribellus sp. YY47]